MTECTTLKTPLDFACWLSKHYHDGKDCFYNEYPLYITLVFFSPIVLFSFPKYLLRGKNNIFNYDDFAAHSSSNGEWNSQADSTRENWTQIELKLNWNRHFASVDNTITHALSIVTEFDINFFGNASEYILWNAITVQLRYIRTTHTRIIRSYFAYTRMSNTRIRVWLYAYTRMWIRAYMSLCYAFP